MKSSKTTLHIAIFTLLLIFLGIVIGLAIIGWSKIYSSFLEINPPIINISSLPRGVGLTPVNLQIKVEDKQSGINFVQINGIQRNKNIVFYRRKLIKGKVLKINLELSKTTPEIDEGSLMLVITAKDKSWWHSTTQKKINLEVDFNKPAINPILPLNKVKIGEPSLIFYKAVDKSLAISGVKIGKERFLGFFASKIDKDINTPNTFGTLFSVPLGKNSYTEPIKLFAEDNVGNFNSISFYDKVIQRSFREYSVIVPREFLEGQIYSLAKSYIALLNETQGKQYFYNTKPGTIDRLIENFKLVNEKLLADSRKNVKIKLNNFHWERYFDAPFLRPSGKVVSAFGDKVTYILKDGSPIGTTVQIGYSFIEGERREVYAVNNGIVLFTDNIGTYGKIIAVDHGLGLVSLYGSLSSISVSSGDAVTRGQIIGIRGNSGFANSEKLYFEMRLFGVPINPSYLWDRSWYYNNFDGKVRLMKTKRF